MPTTLHLSRQLLAFCLAGLMTAGMWLGTDGLARHYEATGVRASQDVLANGSVGGAASRTHRASDASADARNAGLTTVRGQAPGAGPGSTARRGT